MLVLLTFCQLQDGSRDEERQSLYSRFYISGRDMAAFLICDLAHEIYTIPDNLDQNVLSGHTSDDQFCSLLDRCGMSVVVDQVAYIIIKLIFLNIHSYYLA